MVRVAVILAALLLAGCKARISLDAEEWTCTRKGTVSYDTVISPGIFIPGTREGCTQWSRL